MPLLWNDIETLEDKCPNCRTTGMSWLQIAVVAALTVPGLFLLLQLF